MSQWIKDLVKDKLNLTPKQATYTVLAYKASEITIFTGLWVACYRFNPSRHIKNSIHWQNRIQYCHHNYPKTVKLFNQNVQKVKTWVDTNHYAQRFSFHIGVRHKNLTRSFMEGFVINKLSFPVLIPTKLFISVSVAKMLASDTDKEEDEDMDRIIELID
jgi:hypothetical protein